MYSGLGETEKSENYLKTAYQKVIEKADEKKDQKAKEGFLTEVRENNFHPKYWANILSDREPHHNNNNYLHPFKNQDLFK